MNETRGLWRGKRTDNGEWVDGFLVKMWGTVHLQDKEDENLAVPVDPETLGECTGLRDKNGKLIFEGDVVRTKKYGKDVYYSNVNDYDIFVVKFEPALFRLENHNRRFILDDDGYSKLEIIGNIHDNPELLKGAQNEQKNI